jgi:hypothetical protein
MALRDYRLCDACEEKVFYDADLDYRFPTREDPIEPDERAKVCGLGGSYRLQYLGDWVVLCEQCAKTHRTAILPINGPEPSGETMAQREEVCAAWADLPDELRKDPRLTRLYHALGGPRMDDPTEANAGVGIPQTDQGEK